MAFNFDTKVKNKTVDEKAEALKKMPVVKPKTVTPLIKPVEQPKATTFTAPKKTTPAYGTKGFIPKDLPVRANPFMALVNTAALKLPESVLPGYKQALQQAEKESPVATTIASGLGYLSPGSIGVKAVKPLLSKVGAGVGKQVTEGAIVGTGISVGENIVPLLKGEKNLKQVGKEVATGLVTGAALDVGLFKLGKLAKPLLDKIAKGVSLSQAEKQIVAKQANVPVGNVDKVVENYRKTIQEELGLPKDTTAQQYKADVESQAYYDKVKKDTELALNQKNKQVLQSKKASYMQPTQLPSLKPRVQPVVKPLLSDTATPQQLIKPLLDTNIEKPLTNVTVDSMAFKTGVEETSIPLPKTTKTIPMVKSVDDGLGTAENLRERIVTDVKKPKKSFSEAWKQAETQFIDDTAPLKHLEKNITGKVASAEKSIYKTAGLYKGAPERANEVIRTGIKPAIKMAENAGFNHEDLRDYAIAVHAKEVNEAGINSGISTSSAEDAIRKFGTPEMEAARQQLLSVSNKLVDDMFENGLLTKEAYDGLKNKWKNYMPLFREFDDDQVPKGFGVSDKLSGVSAPIKGLKGSKRKVIDPLQGMIKNIYATENAIARNKVGLQLANLSNIDVENRFIRKLDKGEEVGRKNVVNVMIDGKKVGYEVEPEVYKMLQGLDKESSNWIISAMSKPASALRAGATLTPEFALRNPMRDVVNAYVVSKSGFNPFTDFPKGLASVMKKDEYYEQFLKENGGFGNIFSMDRQAHKEALEKVIKQPNSKKFVNLVNPKSYIELLRSISDVTETATKVGEFRKAVSKGETPQEAAYRARNLMDFGKAGSSIREANKVVAFLNANIRGKATLIEAIKENPTKVTGKIMASMILPTVAFKSYNNEFANETQKQTIKDAPQWQKDTFWLVAVPGSDIVARIPKPFDIAAAANATDRFIDYVADNDKEAFNGFAKNTLKGMSVPVMMTGVLPILEAMSNYSQFKQGPIIPEREKFLPRKYQSDSKTSEIAKLAATGIGKIVGEESNFASPRTIDYVIRSSTGGLGSTALDSMDWLAQSIGIVKKPPKPSVGVTGLPIIKGFTVSELSSGKSLSDLYDLKNKLTTEKGGLKFEAKKADKDPKKIYYENEKAYDFVNEITDEIGEISKEMREVTEDLKMSPDEKRRKLKELNDKRNNLSFKSLIKAKSMLNK